LIFPFWCTKTTYRGSQPAQLGETGWCEAVQGTTSMGTRWNRTPVRNWNTAIDIKLERIGKGHAKKNLLSLLWKRSNFTHFLTSTAQNGTVQQGKRSAHLFAKEEVEDLIVSLCVVCLIKGWMHRALKTPMKDMKNFLCYLSSASYGAVLVAQPHSHNPWQTST